MKIIIQACPCRCWFIWLGLAFFTMGSLSAQLVITGTVQDSQSNDPLHYASVSMVDAEADTITTGGLTNEIGRFRITGVLPGVYFLEIEFIGYQTVRSTVFATDTMRQSLKNMGEYFLEPDILELDAVDVSVSAPSIISAATKTIYDSDQLYSATGGTCCDVMKSIPSIDVNADGQVSLRGSPEVAILLNGKRAGILGGERHTNIMAVPVPAVMVDRVEVITSPSASQDADGMVGIINIVVKENKASGFNGHVNVNAGTTNKYNTGAYFNFRKGTINHFWNISTEDLGQSGSGYRRSTLIFPGVSPDIPSFRMMETKSRNRISYLSGGTRYKFSKNAFFKGEIKLVPFQRDQDESIDLDDQHLLLSKREDGSLQLLDMGFISEQEKQYRLSGDITLENQHWNDRQNGREDGTVMDISMKGKTDINRYILNLDYEFFLTPSIKLEAGVKDRYLYQDQPRSVFVGNKEYATDFAYSERIRAAYLNMGYTTFMEDMIFSGGIRLEDAKTGGNTDLDSLLFNLGGFSSDLISNRKDYRTHYLQWYPSFLARYIPNRFSTIQAGYSARVNRPTANFVDLFPRNLFEPSVLNTGNPSLEPEFIHALELKLSQVLPSWRWEVAVFGQRIENVVREDEDLIDSTSVITWKNAGNGSNLGLEGRVKFKPLPFWEMTLTGLYFRTETKQTAEVDLAGRLSGFQGKITQVFTFNSGGKLELDSRLYSPETIPTGTVHPDGLANLNVSYRRSLWDDRLELSLKLLDVFDNEARKSETSEIELSGVSRNLETYTKPDGRTLFLNIRYKFGSGGKDKKVREYLDTEKYRY